VFSTPEKHVAASALSTAYSPFMKKVDRTSDIFIATDVTKAVDKAIDMDAGSAEDEASGNADINEVSTFEVGEIQNQRSVEDETLGNVGINAIVEVQVSAVSRKVAKRVEEFAVEHGLDDKAKSRLMHASTDEMAEDVVSRPLGPRVRNPSAYVTRVIQQLEKEAAAPQHDNHQQDEVEHIVGRNWDSAKLMKMKSQDFNLLKMRSQDF